MGSLLFSISDGVQARTIMENTPSVGIYYSTSKNAAPLTGSISLLYTHDGSLPSMTGGDSLSRLFQCKWCATSLHGNWVYYSRGGLPQSQTFQAVSGSTGLGGPQSRSLTGWSILTVGNTIPATNFFAIVVGFAPMKAGDTMVFQYISLCHGGFATEPAPKQPDEVLRDCERFYEKSYSSQVLPGAITNVNMRCSTHGIELNGTGGIVFQPAGFSFNYNSLKRVAAPVLSIYSPTSATPDRCDMYMWQPPTGILPGGGTTQFSAIWGVAGLGDKSCAFNPIASGYTVGANVNLGSAFINYHYVVDARLGIV